MLDMLKNSWMFWKCWKMLEMVKCTKRCKKARQFWKEAHLWQSYPFNHFNVVSSHSLWCWCWTRITTTFMTRKWRRFYYIQFYNVLIYSEDNTVLYLTTYFDNLCNSIFSHFCIWRTLCYIRPRPASAMDMMMTFTAAMITTAACWLLAAVKQKVETLSRFVTFEPGHW